ncbi:hypothetical protein HBA54_11120 [Pelagibius litoralis]|uniref:Uncharacterized protein n=1 Tax=Pelagibius litoralis TaxID=374515 RepID=A0A967EW32_9PROT|nr:hypothetical protein [Pelagibius litoralis]NIA69139.1 hypothetical protein [Pelagibius litoralis]
MSQMPEIVETRHARPAALFRFAVILRGEDFATDGAEGTSERIGFYIVRTATAADQATAEQLALFDLEAEIRSSATLQEYFTATGSIAVEEVALLDDDIDDSNSGFIFYRM